jgi:hypothetical protein
MRTSIICLLISLVLLFACKEKITEASTPTGKLQGLHKYYFPDGKLYLEVNYKDSVPHGTTKRYFKAGGILEESEYRNGILHGITKTFYEDGTLSSQTPYDSGRIDGIKLKFRKDGTKTYEAPYQDGEPCAGLKEYFLSGNPVNNYPKIVVQPKNKLLTDDQYILEFSLSDNSKSVEFYKGTIKRDGCLSSANAPMYTSKGVARLFYFLPPGGFLMENINVIAKVKTDLGNYYFTQVSYNLAVENR